MHSHNIRIIIYNIIYVFKYNIISIHIHETEVLQQKGQPRDVLCIIIIMSTNCHGATGLCCSVSIKTDWRVAKSQRRIYFFHSSSP